MDLLGGYNSDSDSDESSDAQLPVATAVSTTSSRPIKSDAKLPPTTTLPTAKAKSSKADKKKRVLGKKLLKLSSVLPEHILNQLQQAGGGGSKENHGENDSDSDDSDDDSSHDESQAQKEKPRPKASSRDYSRDEGLMGLLSELSSSSAALRKSSSSKILGSDKPFAPPEDDDASSTQESPEQLTEKPKATKTKTTTTSEPLGAAFLTTTVETTIRKRKGPTTVRNIHEDNSTSIHAAPNPESTTTTVPRPPISNAAPQPRIKPSLRAAAPPVRMASSPYSVYNTYVPPVAVPQHSTHSGRNQARTQPQQQSKKKKPLSRKRQMEQMLRAGKLDQVEGDHQLEGQAHEYHLDGEEAASMMAASTSAAGVRVVPTGSYDPSLGATTKSTNVTSKQKYSNQLNSLLASAASLETQRAQNPHLLSGQRKRGTHSAAMKRKYGW